ncbi:putative transcription factor bZIP family [Medicago truncatula]|uniref:Putative transcription factor bZIP family n=1 Tax=Medicago truncatula TaxID=3880 RepID=A0A396J4G0_MEDTR|nr:putative transcription factor bZIP family [Medicago truncatula]
MRKSKKPNPSNAVESVERGNWEKIFSTLVQMMKNQEKQLQSFADQQNFLQDRLKLQNQRWASDIQRYKDQISQMNTFLLFEEKKRLLEEAKADLMMGSKHREASILKWVLESTKDDLEDFKAGFDYLSQKSSNGEDQGTALKDTDKRKKGTSSSGKKKSSSKIAEKEKCPDETKDELSRVKAECEKLVAEKDSELLALLQEKNFVWNQFNKMETDYTKKLRSKQEEVEKTNEKINILVSSMEEMQSENIKKDSRISELESKVTDMDAETKRLNKEISGLSTELESLRKLKSSHVKPFLNRCTASTSDSGKVESSRSRRNNTLKKDRDSFTPDEHASTSTNFSEKKRSLKRKGSPIIPTTETPKLFSSNFKVPKLKSSLRTG